MMRWLFRIGITLGLLVVVLGVAWYLRRSGLQEARVPVFEIREVACSEETSDRAWQYDCRGTLLTRDDRLQHGGVIVWVEDASKDAKGKEIVTNPGPYFVLMSNGVGTLTSGAYYSRKRLIGTLPVGDYDADPGAPQPGWKVLGFSRVEPVRLEVDK